VPTTTQPPLTTTITVTAPPTTAAIPTSMVTPTPPAEDTVLPRAGLPFLLFIPAALGAVYTVLRIWWHDQGEHTLRLSHLQGVVLGIMHTVSGGGLFILSYLFIGAVLLQSATFGRYVLAVVVMGILILYISFSGFILAYSALKGKGALLLSRVHIIVAILPFSLSLIIITATQVKERLSLLAVTLLTAVSLIIAIWQYLNMIEGGNGGVGTSTAQGRVSSTDTITFLGAEPPHEEPGTVFPQELRERYSDPIYIGKGGIARVFRARRKEDGRSVAVKVPVSFDEATGRSFLKEMRIWEDLHHPNIVEITAVNILPIPFVEMAYYPRTLGEMEMPLPVEVALTIIKGISDGLRYAHEKGVIHRDLKPQNILLTDDLFPKISDWGLSRTLTHETAASLAGFSLPYAAPEQLSPRQFGDTDERTDIYQLGVIFYQVITGTLPFEGEGMYDLSSAIISNAPVPPAALKEELAVVSPIVMRCLEKEMKNRYQSVAELQQDLVPFFHL
ncbi:MAG: protein kinase, partial [Methanomicrobiales archaeon]|nr:protein kinase [Methanomicrobiales archaeon]